jgi:hypothetical protein
MMLGIVATLVQKCCEMTTLRGCELRCIHQHSMAQPFGSAADAGQDASVSWASVTGHP